MITTNQHEASNNHLNPAQQKTLQRFKKKLAQELPALSIAWVNPVKDTIIELHLDYDKWSYRKSLKASTLAADVEDKTGVIIVFR